MARPALTDSVAAARAGAVSPPVRLAFHLVIAVWLVIPLAIRDNLAQDALPYVVAGQLIADDPHQIYATGARDLYDLPPTFAAYSCDLAPEGTDCGSFAVAFVSSPPSLPFAYLLGKLGGSAGILLARMLAAASLSGGMLILWRRFTARTAESAPYLTATAILLTPFAVVPIALGQTSPYLFLLVCAGLTGTSRPARATLTAGLFAGISLLKLFPAVAGAVLLAQRRWRLVAITVAWVAGLAGLAAVLGPTSWYSEFLATSKLMATFSLDNPYNGAVAALVHDLSPSLTQGVPYAVLLAGMAGAVLAAWFARVRRSDGDAQWAFGLAITLLFVPLVWWHYLWLGVGAVAVALATRPTLGKGELVILPAMAAVTIPISIPNGSGSAVPPAQLAFMLATIGLTVWLAEPVPPGETATAAVPSVTT